MLHSLKSSRTTTNLFKAGLISLGIGLPSYYLSKYDKQTDFLFSSEKKDPTKTYIWGNGLYQARPGAALTFKNYFPKLIETFSGKDNVNLGFINFNKDFEVGLDTTGCVYIWPKTKMHSIPDKKVNYNARENLKQIDSKGGFVQQEFTNEFLWGVKKDGSVHQWKLNVNHDSKDKIKNIGEIVDFSVEPVRLIASLSNIKQIATGADHLLALDNDGKVFTMGDDTLGQCGVGAHGRTKSGPFYEQRVPNPVHIKNLPSISAIACGSNHSLVVSGDGNVYGWGSNSKMQLSHENDFSSPNDPLLAAFYPLRIDKNLSNIMVDKVAAGNEFSMFCGINRNNDETEVYGCGHNLKGELGAGFLRHVVDVSKSETLSNLVIKNENMKEEHVKILDLKCGLFHCITLQNIGCVLEWGSNDEGQLGNRKRTFSENPIWLKTFEKENIKSVFAKETSSAIICEWDEKAEMKKKLAKEDNKA